ncbi:MAG: hypothetical protein NVSMB27_41630 [Ktedonobacteraceae bacterium]
MICSHFESYMVRRIFSSKNTPRGHMMILGHVLQSVTVFTVAWSPDGHRIASASDETVKVWFML